ncbi:tetratricopeptide repeat protein [Kordia sp. YSTF-M3]|uniref:Tetratricopeptide repeat protein n=1 Tax=Kordia aestuariivivens TaxID=2759037 RepID=A0ABR7Q3P5_9FLAO|nr:tetratricopeptide repeat protein [Kordia aestuariivivens]MBC8753175.1 tetratricopeptide repeat protein [Kordia aestuariivivens]
MNRLLIVFISLTFISKVGAQSSTFVVADSLYRVGNFSKAIKAYEKLENSSYANTQIAKSYKALGNSKKAIVNYEKALAVDSLNTLVLYDYGKLLFSTGKPQKSLTIFEKLKAKDTLNPNFHYQIGLAKEALQKEDFLSAYKTVFQLDSQHQKSIYKLIVYHLKHKEFEKAAAFINVGLKNNADDAKVIGFNAQLLYALKQHRKALFWFEKLIDRKKATQYVYEKAAFSAYRVGKILKSIAYYEEALKRDQGNYFYHSQLAKLYYQDGVVKKAEHHASQSILAKMIDTSGDYYILGLVAFDRKEHGSAMKLFSRALEENPDYEAAQFQLALCADSYYSDLKATLKTYERFLEKFPEAKLDKQKIIRTRIRELKAEIHLKSE